MVILKRPTLLALLFCLPLVYAGPSAESLFEPFGGFSDEGLAPIWALFQADTEGRQLLRKSVKKTDSRNLDELAETLCYCTTKHLSGNQERRGLFMQQTLRYYRAKGADAWRSESLGGLEKLNDPKNFPIVARREFSSNNFEQPKNRIRCREKSTGAVTGSHCE